MLASPNLTQVLLAGYWSAPQVNLACNYVQRFSLPVPGQDSAIQAVFPLARCHIMHIVIHRHSPSYVIVVEQAYSHASYCYLTLFPQQQHEHHTFPQVCYIFSSMLILPFLPACSTFSPQHAQPLLRCQHQADHQFGKQLIRQIGGDHNVDHYNDPQNASRLFAIRCDS